MQVHMLFVSNVSAASQQLLNIVAFHSTVSENLIKSNTEWEIKPKKKCPETLHLRHPDPYMWKNTLHTHNTHSTQVKSSGIFCSRQKGLCQTLLQNTQWIQNEPQLLETHSRLHCMISSKEGKMQEKINKIRKTQIIISTYSTTHSFPSYSFFYSTHCSLYCSHSFPVL